MCECTTKIRDYKWKAIRSFIWGTLQIPFGIALMHVGDGWTLQIASARLFGFVITASTLMNFNAFFGWLDKMRVTRNRHAINAMEKGLF